MTSSVKTIYQIYWGTNIFFNEKNSERLAEQVDMLFKPWDVSNTPHNLEKHISYLRKWIIIGSCSKMSAAYTSIIDLCLCPFFPENCFYPLLSKFSLFLLRWNSIEFQRALFRSSIRATKCTTAIWHVLILNVKMKFAENWN